MFQGLASNTAVMLFGSSLLFVLMMERHGFLSFSAVSFPALLYTDSVRVWGTLFLSVLALRSLPVAGSKIAARGDRSRRETIWRGISIGGLSVVMLGLWLGGMVYFEGAVRLTEGQDFLGTEQEYVQGSLRSGSRGATPELHFLLRGVAARFAADGTGLEELRAETQWYSGENEEELQKVELRRLPVRRGPVWLNVEDFGYSPYYRLEDEEGRVLDEAFVALALFPPGSEDYFRLLLPHTFYIRYDPSGVRAPEGDGSEDVSGAGGLYHLRIVRNKEIVFNGPAIPGKKVDFENGGITLDPPRKWVRIRIVRDMGLPLVCAGGALSLLAFIVGRRLSQPNPEGKQA